MAALDLFRDAPLADLDRIVDGFVLTFDQEECEPAPEDYDDGLGLGQPCAVCGWTTEGGHTCSAECYRIWNAPPSDSRDLYDAF